MPLIERFILTVLRRRTTVIFLCAVLLGWGSYAYYRLPIEPYPGVAPLTVQVICQWPGRSTLEVERQITIPVETALAGVPDTQTFRSVSLFGLSVVTLKFKQGTDSFKARQNVSLYLQNASIPSGVLPNLSPDADANGEILRYRVVGKNIDLTTVKSYADWDIYKNIKQVSGVTEVINFGGTIKQYQVIPHPSKMQTYGVSLNQLISALTNANSNVGGGLVPAGEQQYVVRGVGLIQSLDDMRNIVVAVNQGVPIRVSDLAEVQLGYVPRLGMVKFAKDGDTVEGIVLMRRGQNPVEVLARVRERIKDLNTSGLLPQGLNMEAFYDRQNLLDMTTHTVVHTLSIGMVLVFIVLYIFLGHLRAAAVTAVVIPLALCVPFIAMLDLGIPANLISLGAIDFGVIADAAVIVVENIIRRMEETAGNINQTIFNATSEVQKAMIYSTTISILVFSQLFFFGGVEGIIFKPMAMTMSFALFASIALSLIFVPAALSYLLKEKARPSPPRFVGWILRYYQPLLKSLIRRPMLILAIALIMITGALVIGHRLGTTYLPTLEENNLWVRVTLPNTVDLSYSSKFADNLKEVFLKEPEIKNVLVQIGRPDDGTDATSVFNVEFGLFMKHPDEWPKGVTKNTIVKRLDKHLNKIPGIEYAFSQYIQDNVAEALSGVKGENAVKLVGPDLEVLHTKAVQIEKILESIRGIVDVGIYRELGQPTLNVTVDRNLCARFGLNVTDIQNLVIYAIGGNPISSVLEGERTFSLAFRFPGSDRETLQKIERLLVDTPDGQRIPLTMVAKVELADGPFFIYRESGKRYIAIRFGVRERDLGSAAAEAQKKVAQSVELPRGYTITWDGQFNQMKTAQFKLAIIIPVTLFIIMLLLYSNFGNIKDAAVVIFNVPFSIIGGILALYLTGEDLSISAGIGFLCLFGIAIQDGVILIAHIRHLWMDQGYDLMTAVVEGASHRLRPVLMTALLAGLGLLPAALSHAIGSQTQRPLALVIVGGMLTTTFLTLLVLPVFYAWINSRHGTKRILFRNNND